MNNTKSKAVLDSNCSATMITEVTELMNYAQYMVQLIRETSPNKALLLTTCTQMRYHLEQLERSLYDNPKH